MNKEINKLKNKILFLAATHGNEQFSLPILKQIGKKVLNNTFDYIIANPKASKIGKRFIDIDLNRVAPGKKNSLIYEEKRAFELVQIFKKYRYVIDTHRTPANTGIFTIVTNPKLENLLFAAALPITNVVIWAPRDLAQPGPLTQFAPCGLEIECGSKNRKSTQKELFKILEMIVRKGVEWDREKIQQKKFFYVYGNLPRLSSKIRNKTNLKEFTEIKYGNETFYPLLIDRYKGITCYKMEEIRINNYSK